jgi:hypothetical protein
MNQLLDDLEDTRETLKMIVINAEQVILEAFDNGYESGYKDGCEETEKKLSDGGAIS